VIKYIGSKRVLVPAILDAVAALPDVATVIDLFSGTSRVGHALKRAGYRVLANDHNAYAATLARCYVAADRERWQPEAEGLIAELQQVPGRRGFVTETYCERSRFFRPENGERIDAIRDAIAERALPPELEAIAITSLMEAADRVDSTTGVQMAYLKRWAPRALQPLSLRVPELLPRAAAGAGEAHALEALQAAATLSGDLAYLDPPYNQHKYLGNYHVWETLVRWDAPEVYGVAAKRVDCRERKSAFNSKPRMAGALAGVVDALDVRHLLVSFNDEGYLSRAELLEMLSTRGEVQVLDFEHKRYVGAQIGIHSPAGEKVGTVSHLRNTESLYVVSTR
jgi:adenine-specific DNA-methyltransferase